MTSEREREIWDDPDSEEHMMDRPSIVHGKGGKPVCFGCFGSKSECEEDEQGVVHCPWANLCEDPEYPYR